MSAAYKATHQDETTCELRRRGWWPWHRIPCGCKPEGLCEQHRTLRAAEHYNPELIPLAVSAGDVVRVHLQHWPKGQWAQGPAVDDGMGSLKVCDFIVGWANGMPFSAPKHHTVELVGRPS